jgi:hypothetical protein
VALRRLTLACFTRACGIRGISPLDALVGITAPRVGHRSTLVSLCLDVRLRFAALNLYLHQQ